MFHPPSLRPSDQFLPAPKHPETGYGGQGFQVSGLVLPQKAVNEVPVLLFCPHFALHGLFFSLLFFSKHPFEDDIRTL
jgi:hypothetical protein